MRRRPLYSACNEDTRSEILALRIGPGDTVVGVSGGGGRLLSLLTAAPSRLLATDRRMDQVAALELKAAALAAMDREGCLRFLGVSPCDVREDMYAKIRPSLTSGARSYWDGRPGLIREGVLYAGRTERALHAWVSLLRRLGRFGWPEELFEACSLEEQRSLLARHARSVRASERDWRRFVNPVLFYAVAQDPSFLRSSHRSLGGYLYRRFIRYAERHLIRDSFFAHLIYRGHYPAGGPLPLYLEPEGYDRARKNLDALEITCSRMEDVVRSFRLRGVLKWSLSDVSCWMSERHFQELIRELCAVGDPGSRLCARNFGVHRSLPSDLQGRLRRLGELCSHLDDVDSAMFYRFEVAEYEGAYA